MIGERSGKRKGRSCQPVRRRSSERGSALLIVFVFAAVVAISLYMELPVAAFEAQRQKEALLVFRGEQYARAVKLFVRKTGHYPSSLKDLEDTNRMRFLRHPYVDPFTGKNDWRLLHAGPGGTLMDSKVNPIQNALGVNPAQATNTTSFGNSNTSGSGGGSAFGSSSFSGGSSFSHGGAAAGQGGNANGFASSNSFGATDQTADSTPPEVVVQAPRQRGPAIAANGSGQITGADASSNGSAQASLPPLPGVPGATAGNSEIAGTAGQNGGPPADLAGSGQPVPGQPNQSNGSSSAGNSSAANGSGPGDLKTSMINNGGGFQQGGSAFGSGQSGQMGTLNSSGLAGVASKAGGHSIKRVNDQSDYSLWEFYYDPRNDTAPGGVQMGAYAQNGANGQTGSGQNAGVGQTSGGFGQSAGTGQSSGFGQSSGSGFGQSGFGQSSGNSSFGNTSNGSGRNSNSFGSTSSFGAQNNSSGNQTDPNQNSPQNPNPAPPDN